MVDKTLPEGTPGTLNEDGSVTVALEYPVLLEGEQLTEIRLKRLKYGVLKDLNTDNLDMKAVGTLIQKHAAIPPSTLDQIDAIDFDNIQRVYLYFLGLDPKTGKKLPPK